MQKKFYVAIAVTIIGFSCLIRSGVASASPSPFTCTSNFYQVINGTLEVLNPSTGAYTNIGPNAGFAYNAIGYNTLDNFIYGLRIGANGGDLLQIASDGTVTDLGLPAGLPAGNYDDGSIDDSGNLYVRATTHSLYKVNIATMTTTTLPLTGVAISGYDSVIIGSNYYTMAGATLFTVNLTTGVASSATVTGPANWLNSSGEFGAAWSDQTGELFFSNNGSGSIYKITDYVTASPIASFEVAGTVTYNNDGANCPLATQNPFDPPVATNDSYLTSYNTKLNEMTSPLLANDSGTALTITSHTNPSHGTITLNSDGSFSYLPMTNFSGTDSFRYTVIDSFGRTSTATVTIITLAPGPAATSLKPPSTGYGVYAPALTTTAEAFVLAGISLLLIGLNIRRLSMIE
jgi:hypothetical protein